ncbi:MAG: hypothetical protein HY695_10535 [Deltaproteobacteria bacterium]|nr:hypothetical protein [Deltaproteobacteria bacterium]
MKSGVDFSASTKFSAKLRMGFSGLRCFYKALAAFLVVFAFTSPASAQDVATCSAIPLSTATLCAEEDNVNIPLSGEVTSFVIEATHPTYPVAVDSCAADFTNCGPSIDPTYSFNPGVVNLYDDGETIVEAVREASWWRPNGMAVLVDSGAPATDIHYVRIRRKIAGASELPEFFVLYMDGNLRLKPHPPVGISDVCFGSSVIVGPAPLDFRPIAEIASARYLSASKTLEVIYQSGDWAILSLEQVDRTIARVRVRLSSEFGEVPFATFRSMFVADGNADVDHVTWRNDTTVIDDEPIITFPGGEGSDWFFYRKFSSQHNTSAPDIRIKIQGNEPPVLTAIGDKTVAAGNPLNFVVSGSDPDGDPLTFLVSGLPPGATFNPVTQQFSWTPSLSQTGIHSGIAFTVSDGSVSATETITITVTEPSHSLTVSAPVNGTITGSGISCPGDCTENYQSGMNVLLTANPASGFQVGAWSGCQSANGNQCTVQMTQNRAVSVTIAAPSDLLVSALSAAATAGPGATISVTDTTKNNARVAAGASTTRFYISRDRILDSADIFVGSRSVSGLAARRSERGSSAVVLPAGTGPGRYYLIAKANGDDAVPETNKNNNSRYKAVKIVLPDLFIAALTAPAVSTRGANILVKNTVKNRGGGSIASTTVRFYLSTDAKFGSGDTPIGSREVSALGLKAVHSDSTSITIPPGMPAGRYYIIAVVDPDDTVGEGNNANNSKYKAITIN